MVRKNSRASYYCARYYDPNPGRFVSEDPVGFNGGMNFFEYSADSPVNYVDPLGLRPKPGQNGWYDWWGWRWVPGVSLTRYWIWSHYCWKVVTEKMKELDKNPYQFTNEDLTRYSGDYQKLKIEICTKGDDNCKRLTDKCGGFILGLIFKTGGFPH